MPANNDERMSGAVDQEAFERVIRDNLSPEAVATIIAFLQPAALYRPANQDARQALRQVEWFRRAGVRIEFEGRRREEKRRRWQSLHRGQME